MKRLLVSVAVFVLALRAVDATFLEAVAVALSLYTLLTFADTIGRQIALLECICSIASLEILLVPAVTYWVFPSSMPVESSVYLSYALPAYLAFYTGLIWFSRNQPERAHFGQIQASVDYLQNKQSASIVLLIIGLGGYAVRTFVPTAPASAGLVPSYCLLISAFYAYYSKSALRLPIIGIVFVVLLAYTVQEGMFGELFLWLIFLTLFVAARMPEPPTTRVKSGFILVAFAFLLLIQSIKGEYRRNTWGYQRGERSGDASLLGELIADRLANPEKMLNVGHVFVSFVRFNQGIMIGSAMAKVPTHEAYANGEVLLSFIYPLVPRLLWPDKPQTGGYQNIRRFTTLRQSENTSINLSPLGEGYVNFGYGGIFFALLYGLLLGGIFRRVIRVSGRVPSLIFWLPALFIGCLTMETDILSTWGSLANNIIFVAGLFWLTKRVGIHL